MSNLVSASQLLALAEGLALNDGDERCLFCGAPCDASLPAAEHMSSAFTDFASLAWPASEYVCVGCTRATAERGHRYPDGGPFGLAKVRNYSWVFHRRRNKWRADYYTKADALRLRAIMLDPPEPPLAIVLAESGQKHLLPRAAVARQREPLAVQFEEQQIVVRRSDLVERLRLTDALVPLLTKTMLRGGPPPAAVHKVVDRAGTQVLDWLDEWLPVRGEPLSEVALFLTPTKDIYT